MHERVEEVFLPLLIAINSVLLEEGCKIALEIKLVASSWEAGYLSFDLFALHSTAPSKSVRKRGRGRLDDCGRHYSNATTVCLIRSPEIWPKVVDWQGSAPIDRRAQSGGEKEWQARCPDPKLLSAEEEPVATTAS